MLVNKPLDIKITDKLFLFTRMANRNLMVGFQSLNVKITAELKSRMMYSGNLMVGYQPLDNKPNFFRLFFYNTPSSFYSYSCLSCWNRFLGFFNKISCFCSLFLVSCFLYFQLNTFSCIFHIYWKWNLAITVCPFVDWFCSVGRLVGLSVIISSFISRAPFGALIQTYFRSIISNQACQEEDIDFMLEEIDRLGIDL